MASEKIAMNQRAMIEEEQARIGNQKWTQYLAAFIGIFPKHILHLKNHYYKNNYQVWYYCNICR